MKVAIFAGGRGSRLIEETQLRPKPLVEIGKRPILWHIMMHYSTYGHHDFVVALGYMGYMIKQYMADLCQYSGDLRIDFARREMLGAHGVTKILNDRPPPWIVDLIETGEETLTGGRLQRLRRFVGDESFMLTYGDGVSDVDLNALVDFHRSHGKLATMTMVRPYSTFGHVEVSTEGQVKGFQEKPETMADFINGGFFVLEPEVFDAIADVTDDDTMWEAGPLRRLTEMGQLMAYKHSGFWYCMDHLADKRRLEGLWNDGTRPWASWEKNGTCDRSPGFRGDSRHASIGRGGIPGDWVRYQSL